MKRRKCININTNAEYYLISKFVVDQDGTGFDYLLQPYIDEGAEYMVCSDVYFEKNFRIYEYDYTKIKSPFDGNEELLKQCSTFPCPGWVLNSNFGGFFCLGHGLRTWNLDVYRDCDFESENIYMITVYPETGKVVDIYE